MIENKLSLLNKTHWLIEPDCSLAKTLSIDRSWIFGPHDQSLTEVIQDRINYLYWNTEIILLTNWLV